MTVIIKIYIATMLFTYVCFAAMALDMSSYIKKTGWKRVKKSLLREKVSRLLILVLWGILPIVNIVIGVLVLANAKDETYRRALREDDNYIWARGEEE